MAKVIAPFKLKGSIGDLTFYENEYGPQVKTKSSPTKWHIKHHKGFRNARRNAAEFGGASEGAQLLRVAIGELYKSVKNIRLNGRMMVPLVKAVKANPMHDWGERSLMAGDLRALEGFEFNHTLELDDALPFNIEHCYIVDGDRISLQVPAFRIRKKKSLPEKATHYRVVSALITVDFDRETYHRDIQKSPAYAIGRQAGAAFTAEHVLAPGTTGQFWMVGVEFFASDEAGQAPLKGGALKIMQYIRPVLSGDADVAESHRIKPRDCKSRRAEEAKEPIMAQVRQSTASSCIPAPVKDRFCRNVPWQQLTRFNPDAGDIAGKENTP